MTYIPGMPLKFDEPNDWRPCVKTWKCRKCKSSNGKYRIHSSSDGAFDDDEIKCSDCGHVYWSEGIDS